MALKENYRELLIDAVVRVAAREGLDRTTTKLIAAEVPCNEVYIYRNFGSKDALLQAAFSRTDLRFVQTILKNLDVMDAPGQPLEQRCRALWEPVWRFCLAQPDDIRFYLRYYYSAQFLASAHELHHRNYQQLQARLSRYFISSHDSWLLMAHIFETILSFVSHVLCGDLRIRPNWTSRSSASSSARCSPICCRKYPQISKKTLDFSGTSAIINLQFELRV